MPLLLLQGQTPANDPHWELLWEDHFTSTFDTNKWVKAEACDHAGEPQLYTADNVDIWNGKLRIRLFNEFQECEPQTPTTWICGSCMPDSVHNHTSGWVNTKRPSICNMAMLKHAFSSLTERIMARFLVMV